MFSVSNVIVCVFIVLVRVLFFFFDDLSVAVS